MKRLTTRSWQDFRDALSTLEPFRTHGQLWGTEGAYLSTPGRLPEPWLALYRRSWRDESIDFLVYSYNTPIAWHHAPTDTWIAPLVYYSTTTSRHQNKIFAAIEAIPATPVMEINQAYDLREGTPT